MKVHIFVIKKRKNIVNTTFIVINICILAIYLLEIEIGLLFK